MKIVFQTKKYVNNFLQWVTHYIFTQIMRRHTSVEVQPSSIEQVSKVTLILVL